MKLPLRSRILTATIAATLFVSSMAADAAYGPPSFIDYQGRVVDGNGAPLAPTTATNYEITFRIYDALTGGTVIWAEKQLVTVLNGQFSVRLGEGQPVIGSGGAEEGSVNHASPGLPGAFGDNQRYLGVTVNLGNGQTSGEIVPRLAFLASPFSYVSATAGNLVQAPGTQSNLTVGSIAYSTQTLTSSAVVSGNSRTVLVNSTTGIVDATLPQSGAQKEILIAKTDSSANMVMINPPANGTINGNTSAIRLKVKGESLTLQNVGNNDWWIINDNRDKTPVGTIIAFGGNGNPPAGYLLCDGTSLSRTLHADLFVAIGTQWGAVDASNFNVPQLAGRFLRGVGQTANGADDDTANRYSLLTGGATGRNVGSYQDEQLKNHTHTLNDPGHSHGASAGAIAWRRFVANGGDAAGYNPDVADSTSNSRINAPTIFNNTTGISVQNSGGGLETRPDNAGVRYCIKY